MICILYIDVMDPSSILGYQYHTGIHFFSHFKYVLERIQCFKRIPHFFPFCQKFVKNLRICGGGAVERVCRSYSLGFVAWLKDKALHTVLYFLGFCFVQSLLFLPS